MKLAASFDGVCYAPLTQIGRGIAATDLPACMESEVKEGNVTPGILHYPCK